MNEIYIALGANLPSGKGLPIDTLKSALNALHAGKISVDLVSRFYRTPCFPAGAGPDYVNAVARLGSSLSPYAILTRLHQIEAQFGRHRTRRWGMRTLDLDLIAVADTILPDLATFEHWRGLAMNDQSQTAPDQLILPHPRLQERAFVLVPMRDVAPQWRHPVLNRTVEDMCNALPPDALAEVVAL